MKTRAEKALTFIGTVERTSKAGNQYKQIMLFDDEDYEKYTFFLQDSIDLSMVETGKKVNAIFEIAKRGFNNNVNLISLYQAK